MSKLSDWIKVALLTVIAICGVVTASEVRRIARTDFEVELSVEQADSLLTLAKEAEEQAAKDWEESE